MKEKILIYPVIVTECNDEAGHYYGISSPNIKGMVTDGKTMQEAVLHAEDAIATMIWPTIRKYKIRESGNLVNMIRLCGLR